jgi:hypothetical protein
MLKRRKLMRTMQRVRAGWLVGALGVCVLFLSGAARAQLLTTTERPGSILIFPKVVNDGTRDTVIQITNTGTMLNRVRCFYLDSASCEAQDFEIALTKQQPTIWRVGEGRRVSSTDGFPGIDPGNVGPRPPGFIGALICVEVAEDDSPLPMDKLKGEATLEPSALAIGIGNQEYSKYNAIALQGATNLGEGDNVLNLDTSEYAGCPAASRVNFIPDGSTSESIETFGNGGTCVDTTPAVPLDTGIGCNVNAQDCTTGPCAPTGPDTCECRGGKSRVSTILTVLPCDLDLENASFPQVTVDIDGTDDMERHFSTSHPLTCWGSFAAGSATGTAEFATAVLSTPSGESPIVGVAESFFADSLQNTASTAANLHMEGTDKTGVITLTAVP